MRVQPSDSFVSDVWTVLVELRPQLTFERFVELLGRSQQPTNNYHVTIVNGNCVAVAGWRIHNDSRIGRHAYVADLVVSQMSRGQGLGRALIRFVAEEARSAGCTNLILDSGITNVSAHLFYESIGLQKTAVQFTMPLHP